ncbi:hypothetical protein Cgig2_028125 [Carnegiea gigantea]|uniref:Uncharacterized protein n=1 Tax=Carnegiea gigantea TaxID=171969 RepID=A0A9Q1KIP2_9CARY|nr:hypothetical protein Cgig2_028125 [Carnegiea gigantea]
MDALPRETLKLEKIHRFKSLKMMEVDLKMKLDPKPFRADHGRLENGLSYYVRCNSKPQMRAALALAVKVGSVLEEENERGIAHIVEHLAFSATNKYTNHDLVKFLESIGAEFGACGNAYTSFDETVYELFVPIDKPGLLSEAVAVCLNSALRFHPSLSESSVYSFLHDDFCYLQIRISPEDLEKERGAVLEEYRLGRDANGRLAELCFASVLQGSKYAKRLPIGLESVIRKAPAEAAKGFYKKWYNLHNMAVIAVGDFPDTESVVEVIREHFGQKHSPKPPVIPITEVRRVAEMRCSCFAEAEARRFHECLEPGASVTEEELHSVVSDTDSLEKDGNISDWEDDLVPEEIIHVKPKPGHIVQQSNYKDIGVTELTLSNGMKVCYKCADFKNDQVIFKGYSYEGYSQLVESGYLSCLLSSSIAGEIGKYGYKPTVLVDMLAGKRASVSTDLGAYTRSFIGDCSPSDFEAALQLVYQLFVTQVQPEEEDIKRVIHIVEEIIHAEERDPYTAFSNRLMEIPISISDLPKIDPKKACEYFDHCFKDPSAFTVVIVGNIDPAMAHPLILEYLGGIPRPSDSMLQLGLDDLKGLPSNPPAHIVKYSPMVEAQCSVHISMQITLHNETMMEEMWFVAFLSQLLQTKMTQVLRFQHGQIYSVSVDSDFGYSKPSKTADLEGEISIGFSCDPNVSATLVDVALDEISNLQECGPSENDVSAVLEIEQRNHENDLQGNIYWLFQILRSYHSRLYSGDLGSTFEALDKARSRVHQTFSPLTAKWALHRILPYPCKGHYIAVTLMPETNPFCLLKHQLKTQLKQKYYGRYEKTVDKVRRVFARKK